MLLSGSFTECTLLTGATSTERKYTCPCAESQKCDAVYFATVDKTTAGNRMELCEMLVSEAYKKQTFFEIQSGKILICDGFMDNTKFL